MMSIKQIISIHEEFLTQARELNGTSWKEISSEVHGQYKELPVWIILYEDSAVEKTHEDFKSFVSKYLSRIGDYQFTVTYQVYDGDTLITLDFLCDNDEIMRTRALK